MIFFMAVFICSPKNLYLSLITKEGSFIQIQLKLMSKMKKYHEVSLSVTDPPTPHQSSCANVTFAKHKSEIVP